MGNAKVVTMSAKPIKSTLLCFEVGGICGDVRATLGSKVTPFDFTTFYAALGTTAAGDPSLLDFNSQGILNAAPIVASNLASLRSEPRAATLDKAVVLRQNAYHARYRNIPTIVSTAQGLYGSGPTAKPALLAKLASLSQQQADLLDKEYTADGRKGVIKSTNSFLNSTTNSEDSSSGRGESFTKTISDSHTDMAGRNWEHSVSDPRFKGTVAIDDPPFAGQPTTPSITDPTNAIQQSYQEGSSGETSEQSASSQQDQGSSQFSRGWAQAVEAQNIVNTDYSYRVPAIENEAQNARAQISLIDQQYSQFLAGLTLSNLTTVMQNELKSIDFDIYQLQIGFLNSILLSPIAGVVTGIYKNPGDCVSPGEPVVRVEDNANIFLLATLVYRDTIQIGSTINVTTTIFDTGGAPTTLSGNVVAVRGRDNDDKWDILVQCINPSDGAGKLTFPLGYVFDYDNTTVTVT